jgi:chloramphenicol O-acetyltransferase
VYSKILKVVKGVDTVLEFQFLNQDQKPINLENTTLTFKLISENTLLMSKILTIVTPSKGKASITLSNSDLSAIETQRANYSIQRVFNSLTELAYVDENAGTQGVIDILPAVS